MKHFYKINLTVICFSTLIMSCSNNYKKDLATTYDQTVKLTANSLVVSEQISSTWNEAIFDRNYSFGGKSEYVSDFNEAIQKLKQEQGIKALDKSIDSLKTLLKTSMIKLKNPPSDYEETYEELVTLYANTSELSNMATNPNGSLQSYRQSLNDLSAKIKSSMSQIEIRNPEIVKLEK